MAAQSLLDVNHPAPARVALLKHNIMAVVRRSSVRINEGEKEARDKDREGIISISLPIIPQAVANLRDLCHHFRMLIDLNIIVYAFIYCASM